MRNGDGIAAITRLVHGRSTTSDTMSSYTPIYHLN